MQLTNNFITFISNLSNMQQSGASFQFTLLAILTAPPLSLDPTSRKICSPLLGSQHPAS